MDLHVSFPISGVTTWIFLPPIVAFVVSFFSSMIGVSGAFLLLPFQISCLHFVTPSVSATNFVYNLVAVPSGVYRYVKEGRMAWHLAWLLVGGTVPGVFFGYYLRVVYLPDPGSFRLFVGCVLLYVGIRLLLATAAETQNNGINGNTGSSLRRRAFGADRNRDLPVQSVIRTIACTPQTTEYEFCGNRFPFATPKLMLLTFVVGVVGGAYGIGGGSMMAPLCVAFFGLPVYMVAGASLFGTFLTSIAGVLFYTLAPVKHGVSTSPDWLLGILFGLGGIAGMYCGARMQRFVPQKIIQAMLGITLAFLAISYITKFFA